MAPDLVVVAANMTNLKTTESSNQFACPNCEGPSIGALLVIEDFFDAFSWVRCDECGYVCLRSIPMNETATSSVAFSH